MDESGERDGVAAATVIQTPRRNVRRKLVQSTLLPRKSEDVIESNGDLWSSDGEGGGGDGDFCSSQRKKTRKQRTTTPKKKNGAPKKVGSLFR